MLRKFMILGLFVFLGACSSSQEPQNSIGSGRDERSLSPCACVKMETLGNQNIEAYRLYLEEQLLAS